MNQKYILILILLAIMIAAILGVSAVTQHTNDASNMNKQAQQMQTE